MNTIAAIVIALLLTALILAIGYWWYRKNKPIHSFIGVDFGANSAQPKHIKNLFGPFKFKRNDKTTVNFPAVAGYHIPRQDGKGTLFFGDLNTGQLFKPKRDAAGNVILDFVHGIFMEKAFSDGRVQQIVSSTKGNLGLKLEHLAIGLGIIIMLLLFNVYQYATG